MNDDYLWNKSGSDPEIGRLEEVLSALRYDETRAPRLPIRQTAVTRRFGWKLSLGFAFAACAALLFVGIALRTQNGSSPSETSYTAAEDSTPAVAESRFDEPDRIVPGPERVPRRLQPIVGKKRVSPIRSTSIARNRARQNEVKAIAQRSTPLTSEEKYAYGQLMLALSITRSKLRIVSNTINGADSGSTDASPDNKR